MTPPPTQPKIYHITHIDNLTSIVAAGCIESDRRRNRAAGQAQTAIGMTEIKRRRLLELDVPCHPGTKVGDYVPFYFCPRSIMLFIIYKDNHPDMTFHGGQGPILHLQADMESVINWADEQKVHWAFSDRNAGSYYTDFYNNRAELDQVNWEAVRARDFRELVVKEGKQAEFLVHDTFPWQLVEKIGVINTSMFNRVNTILQSTTHKPVVKMEQSWYY